MMFSFFSPRSRSVKNISVNTSDDCSRAMRTANIFACLVSQPVACMDNRRVGWGKRREPAGGALPFKRVLLVLLPAQETRPVLLFLGRVNKSVRWFLNKEEINLAEQKKGRRLSGQFLW